MASVVCGGGWGWVRGGDMRTQAAMMIIITMMVMMMMSHGDMTYLGRSQRGGCQ